MIKITNNGSVPLKITNVTLNGNAGEFTIKPDLCTQASIESHGSCTITIGFIPRSVGRFTGSLVISDNAADSPQTVTLTGTGTPQAASFSLDASSLDFTNQRVDTSSPARPVRVTNTGSVPLSLKVSVSGASDFSLKSGCDQTIIAPGGRCDIDVVFTPKAPESRSASLIVSGRAADSPQSAGTQQTVRLSGVGANRDAVISLEPNPINFDKLKVGASRLVTVTNVGPVAIVIKDISLSGVSPDEFSIKDADCRRGPIAPGKSCNINIIVTKESSEGRHGILKVAYGPANR